MSNYKKISDMVDFFFKKMYFAPMQKEATATLVMRYFQSRHGQSLVITFSSVPKVINTLNSIINSLIP